MPNDTPHINRTVDRAADREHHPNAVDGRGAGGQLRPPRWRSRRWPISSAIAVAGDVDLDRSDLGDGRSARFGWSRRYAATSRWSAVLVEAVLPVTATVRQLGRPRVLLEYPHVSSGRPDA